VTDIAVSVDVARCVGSGQCALTVPEIFDQADDGSVVLHTDRAAAELAEAVHDAADRCPVRAISLRRT
jgi:ferredoxin